MLEILKGVKVGRRAGSNNTHQTTHHGVHPSLSPHEFKSPRFTP